MDDVQETVARETPLEETARDLLGEGGTETALPPERAKGGRPRGRKDSRPRKRPARDRRPARESSPEPETPPAKVVAEPSEAEVQGLAKLCAIVWGLVARRFNRAPLEAEESVELARAALPVLVKYGAGELEKWGAEIGLGLTVLGLWNAKELRPVVSTEIERDATGSLVPVRTEG